MKKFIVTTTVNPPTEALLKFSRLDDWKLIVVGDLKTPHELYKEFDCIYVSPEYQDASYKELSDAIGWNSIQRRNIGFIEAYKLGADIVATVDDDNVPYETWGKNLLVGTSFETPLLSSNGLVFDPLKVTNHPELWHRGFPLEYAKEYKVFPCGVQKAPIKIQADLWDGDPDVDAVCRKLHNPQNIEFLQVYPFSSRDYMPFNSQNTFIHRDVLPHYMCLPHIGRMDDIWGAYLCEYLTGERPVFCSATVKQIRNQHSLKKDFLAEVLGYTDTLEFLYELSNWREYLPTKTVEAFDLYVEEYERLG